MSSPIPSQPRSSENFEILEPLASRVTRTRIPELSVVHNIEPRDLLGLSITHPGPDTGPVDQSTINELGRIHEHSEVVPAILTSVVLHCAGVQTTEREQIKLRQKVYGLIDRYNAEYKDPKRPKSNIEIAEALYDTTERMRHPLLETVDTLLTSNLGQNARVPAKIIRFALLEAGIRQPTEDVQ